MKDLNNYRKMNIKLIKDQKHIIDLIQVKWVIIITINLENKLKNINNDCICILIFKNILFQIN